MRRSRGISERLEGDDTEETLLDPSCCFVTVEWAATDRQIHEVDVFGWG